MAKEKREKAKVAHKEQAFIASAKEEDLGAIGGNEKLSLADIF